ncbi:MAG: nuclear transport factor 2 family protein, partial [Acidimicrobiaceae bacterium]|nr:nuclear transport factor 2 family protein [Acidimicrobiaceae bacterium]
MEAQLEARLRAVEDRVAIENLEGRYARTWDTGDATGWAAVFTEDGEWEAKAAGTQAGGG